VVNIVNHDKGAKILLAGIETMHMIRKGQLDSTKGASRFRSEPVLLPGVLSRGQSNGFVRPDQLIATEPKCGLGAARRYCRPTTVLFPECAFLGQWPNLHRTGWRPLLVY
jgi:hypothetical protein